MREIKRFGRMHANPEKPPSGGPGSSDPVLPTPPLAEMQGDAHEWKPLTSGFAELLDAAKAEMIEKQATAKADMEARQAGVREMAKRARQVIAAEMQGDARIRRLEQDAQSLESMSEANRVKIDELRSGIKADREIVQGMIARLKENAAASEVVSQVVQTPPSEKGPESSLTNTPDIHSQADKIWGPEPSPTPENAPLQSPSPGTTESAMPTEEVGFVDHGLPRKRVTLKHKTERGRDTGSTSQTEVVDLTKVDPAIESDKKKVNPPTFKEGQDSFTLTGPIGDRGKVKFNFPYNNKNVKSAYEATRNTGAKYIPGASFTIDEFPQDTPEGVQESIERVRSSLDRATESDSNDAFTVREEDLDPQGRHQPAKTQQKVAKPVKAQSEENQRPEKEITDAQKKEPKKTTDSKAAPAADPTPEAKSDKKEQPKQPGKPEGKAANKPTQSTRAGGVEFAPGANFATGNSSSLVEGGHGETITDYATFDTRTNYLYQKDTGPYNEPKMFENVTGNEQTLTASVAETVPMNWGSREKSSKVDKESTEGKEGKEGGEKENEKTPEDGAGKKEGEKPARIKIMESIMKAFSSKEATPAEAPKRGWFGRFFRGIGLIIKGVAIVTWETLKLVGNLVITAGEAIWEGGKSFFGKGGGAKS